MIQFNKLRVNQPQDQVIVIKQGYTLCEICGDGGHSADLCGSNLESMSSIANAQMRNLTYVEQIRSQWVSLSMHKWGIGIMVMPILQLENLSQLLIGKSSGLTSTVLIATENSEWHSGN